MRRSLLLASVAAAGVSLMTAGSAFAAPLACERPEAGAAATPPRALRSRDGRLDVNLDYVTSKGANGRTLFCFVTPDGIESPTLYVKPGDTLNIKLTNDLPAPPPPTGAGGDMKSGGPRCGDTVMNTASVNMHFHGTNTAPTCHSDEVIRTLVNSGETFEYHVKFPANEPPGLYWYHPHVHGIAETALLGGASGAIVVEGIEKFQPAVAGLPERVLIIRDQHRPGIKPPAHKLPSWDLSLNYVPVDIQRVVTPAVIPVVPGRRELWRVLNASADTVLDVRLNYDGADQLLGVVGLDGVPTGSQDGAGQGKIVWTKHILMPTASRAEFIVTTPAQTVQNAELETARVDVGPAGDNDPPRPLAVLSTAAQGPTAGNSLPKVPRSAGPAPRPRFDGLDSAKITAQRTLYFSEVFEDSKGASKLPDDGPIQFYITEVGHKPRLFSPTNRPAIVTTQGAVEEWTIENRTEEVHEFHIHQIHFKLIKRNGVLLPPDQQQYLDTVQVPFWTGRGPKPSVTVLMDFRGDVTGDFVYHCHILEHEDGGMMATICVLPKGTTAMATSTVAN